MPKPPKLSLAAIVASATPPAKALPKTLAKPAALSAAHPGRPAQGGGDARGMAGIERVGQALAAADPGGGVVGGHADILGRGLHGGSMPGMRAPCEFIFAQAWL